MLIYLMYLLSGSAPMDNLRWVTSNETLVALARYESFWSGADKKCIDVCHDPVNEKLYIARFTVFYNDQKTDIMLVFNPKIQFWI